MSDDQALEAALRAAGHQGPADQLRDHHLAQQLLGAGHDQAAALLEGRPTPRAPEQPAANPDEAEGRALLAQLRQQGIVKAQEED